MRASPNHDPPLSEHRTTPPLAPLPTYKSNKRANGGRIDRREQEQGYLRIH